MRILISGAGIGGLTAALCLRKAGHEVAVIEQAYELSEIGAGLQLGANATKVMEHLGLMEQIKDLSVQPERVSFRDYRSGKSLYDIELGERYVQQYGSPYLHIHRADLQSLLVEKLQRVPGSLMLGTGVVLYDESSNDISVQLSNRQTLRGDLLIGADGIRSTVRDQLLGKIIPNYTNNVAWRGVIDTSHLPDDWMDTIVSNFVGPKKHVIVYYLRRKKLANFVGVVENSSWKNDSWVETSPWEELRADFEGWHPTVEAIIDAVDKTKCYRWALHDHKPLNNWSSKRVTLLGDAAHATLPFMASGAAMAIEDARILDRALHKEENLEGALQCYQSNRMKRTRQIQTSSADLGKIYHIESDLLRKLTLKAVEIFGRRRVNALASYDANTIKLL